MQQREIWFGNARQRGASTVSCRISRSTCRTTSSTSSRASIARTTALRTWLGTDFRGILLGTSRMWVIWNDDPGENVEHIAEHGLLPEDVERVMETPDSTAKSHSSGRPCVFGYTEDGRYIIVIYDQIDEGAIYPVTAYEVPEP